MNEYDQLKPVKDMSVAGVTGGLEAGWATKGCCEASAIVAAFTFL